MNTPNKDVDPLAATIEELIWNMYKLTPEDFFALHPEARELVRKAAELESEPESEPGWGSPAYEAALDEIQRRFPRRRPKYLTREQRAAWRN